MLVSLISAAAGQEVGLPAMNAQLFHATVDGQLGLAVDDARVTPDRTLSTRAQIQYTRDPLAWEYEDGETVRLLSDLLAVEVLAGYTFGRVRAGVDLPLYLVSAGDLRDGDVSFGDASLDLKVVALDPQEMPVGLAVAGRLTLPTATGDMPLGTGGVSYELGLVGSQRFGDWSVAANLGTRGVPAAELGDLEWGPHFVARGGVARDIGESAGVGLELSAASVYASFLADPGGSPVEAMLGGWYRATPNAVVRLGAGTGLTPGVGAPLARVVASIGFEPAHSPDRDLDGVANHRDACIDIPEDPDDFADADGCPDPDNDGDGLADVDDDCPLDPEDIDAFEDDDGCSDADNDADGLADGEDACADVAEDMDAWEDTDGCPEPTRVRLTFVGEDGEPAKFAQVRVGEDSAGARTELLLEAGRWPLRVSAPAYEDLDSELEVPPGPPVDVVRTLIALPKGGQLEVRVTGTAGDPIEANWSYYAVGEAMQLDEEPIVGGVTQAQAVQGTYLVNVTSSGYAPSTQRVRIRRGATTVLVVALQPARVVVGKERVELLDKIYFDTGKTTIRKVSYPLLSEIARVLNDHPELRKLRVEGHTDSRGSDTANLTLSAGRAKAVAAWLAKAGVSAERLTPAGFGEARPVDPTENEAAYDRNRRVEFVIEEREP